MDPELIVKAGLKAGPLVTEAFAEKAKDIAAFIQLKKIEKGKDVTIKLGTIKIKTVGEDLHVKFDGELAEKTDIGSDTAIVTLQEDFFDKDKDETQEGSE